MKKKVFGCIVVLIFVLLLSSLLFIVCGGYSIFYSSYLQSEQDVYNMECGIIYNNLTFREGEICEFKYNFNEPIYAELLSDYGIQETAGEGDEFQKALNLMNEFAPRLIHKSDYDNQVEMSSVELLKYALDNPKQGINCRAKSQILNEMYLALGIYSRKMWINPYSIYDSDCHVVNEIWSTDYNKWIMLDITNNLYFVDENKTPLSVLEIREKYANQQTCVPVKPDDTLENLEKSLDKNMWAQLYFAKNMVWLEYMDSYGVGEADILCLMPKNLDYGKERKYISVDSVIKAPC